MPLSSLLRCLVLGGKRLLSRTKVTLGEHAFTRLGNVLPSGVRLLQGLVQRFGLRWNWLRVFRRAEASRMGPVEGNRVIRRQCGQKMRGGFVAERG